MHDFAVPRKIPVFVVSGFLGSGKTTLLNYVLSHSGGVQIGIVVNDFGAINIDSLLVTQQSDTTISLGNGCMCCSLDSNELDIVLGDLVNNPDIDAVFIETSGIAEPSVVVSMVVASTYPQVRFSGLIYVVDSVNFITIQEENPEINSHLALAHVIMVNKIDHISESEVSALVEKIRDINPLATLLCTSFGKIDLGILLNLPEQASHDQSVLPVDHVHDKYQVVSFFSSVALHPRRLAAFLENPPKGVYRIKGVVHFDPMDHVGRWVVHTVGGIIDAEYSSWSETSEPSTSLVVIGLGIDESEIHRQLFYVCRHQDDRGDEQAIFTMLRYVDQEEIFDLTQDYGAENHSFQKGDQAAFPSWETHDMWELGTEDLS